MFGISGGVLITLGHGVGILALVIMAYSFLVRGLQDGSRMSNVITGLVFGAAAILALHGAITITPGVMFDTRNILIALAAPFGGPVAAAVGAGLAGAYRLSMGGPGAWAGTASILVAAAAGIVFTRFFRPRDGAYRVRDLALLGVMTSFHQATIFLMPADLAWRTFETCFLPLTAITIAGVTILGAVLGAARRRLIVEARSKERDAVFHAIFHNAADCFYLSRREAPGRYTLFDANPAGLAKLGLVREDALGRDITELYPAAIGDKIVGDLERCALSREVQHFEDNQGGRQSWEVSLVPIPGHDGDIKYIHGCSRDITWRVMAEARLKDAATTDMLTGLANRRAFDETAISAVALAHRQRRPLAALMIDADHFKAINDRYGHDVGDAVLVALADTLRRQARPGDLLARLGGEEFALIMTGSDDAGAATIAERIRRAVEAAPVPTRAGRLRLTVSIGVAALGPTMTTLEQLLQGADQALYRAKRDGRNLVRIAGWHPSPTAWPVPAGAEVVALDQYVRRRRAGRLPHPVQDTIRS